MFLYHCFDVIASDISSSGKTTEIHQNASYRSDRNQQLWHRRGGMVAEGSHLLLMLGIPCSDVELVEASQDEERACSCGRVLPSAVVTADLGFTVELCSLDSPSFFKAAGTDDLALTVLTWMLVVPGLVGRAGMSVVLAVPSLAARGIIGLPSSSSAISTCCAVLC